MSLVTPKLLITLWVTYLGELAKSVKKSLTQEASETWSLIKHSTVLCRNPSPSGICSELIRHFKQSRVFLIFTPQSPNGQHPTLGTNCCTGVVYHNVSVLFMHWALSINNKGSLVSLANIY